MLSYLNSDLNFRRRFLGRAILIAREAFPREREKKEEKKVKVMTIK